MGVGVLEGSLTKIGVLGFLGCCRCFFEFGEFPFIRAWSCGEIIAKNILTEDVFKAS